MFSNRAALLQVKCYWLEMRMEGDKNLKVQWVPVGTFACSEWVQIRTTGSLGI